MASREQFEEFVDSSFPFKKDRFHMFRDEYKSQFTRQLWEAWQAASKVSEQQLAAVVAENAGLKEFCKNAAFDADYEAELGMERGGFTDALNDTQTPATDAYLAEVRASAIEHAASERWGSGYVFDELNEFAAQLRQGEGQ